MKSKIQAKDLRGNEQEELVRTLRKLEEDLFQNRLKKNTNQLENTMLVRNARRDIARIKTVLSERATGAVRASAPATPAKEK
jgi:large subunit ribosomal protein L29